jgi:hypothetical protein
MREIYTVFQMTPIKLGSLNTYSKFDNPIHCCGPNNPLAGINFWKAIVMPAMGR